MKIVRVENLRPGMQLARSVYSADGRVLLKAGVFLKESHITRLRQLGYPAVYIGDPEEMQQISEVVSEETRLRAIRAVMESFESVKLGGTLVVENVATAVNSIVDEVIINRNVVVHLTDIRSYDTYTFGHCVNVSVLATIIGISLELNSRKLRELAMGAILHDVGKVRVPDAILLKPAPLTDAEWAEMKRHTEYGFAALRACRDLSLQIAHVAYQHHERLNGQGYPRGLKGEDIHLFARIVAVADAYDAMTADRVYRRAMPPFEALRVIRELRGSQFDPDVVDAFLQHISPYPPGCTVELDTGEIGIVVSAPSTARQQPVVRLYFDARGNRLQNQVELDLQKHPGRRIQRVLSS